MFGKAEILGYLRNRANRGEQYLFGVVVGIILAAGLVLFIESCSPRIPDFASIESAAEKKTAFFQYLLPYIHAENSRIMETRSRILELQATADSGKGLSRQDLRWLERRYREVDLEPANPEDQDFFKDLLSRVDAIPPSLALAQAAIESGWGTSRFARKGFNFFGIWCYTRGCGMVPQRRPPGATHEVTRYRSVRESVGDYFQSINTKVPYLPLRLTRAELRKAQKPISGMSLATGLERYSERGRAYVTEVQEMIQSNRLSQYDG